MSYRHNNNQTKDNAFLHDCIDVTCDNEMHQENYETNVYRRKDSCHSVTSLKCAEAVIYGVDSKPLLEMHNLDPTGRQVSSPESSPRSSGSEVSCSFCDDSIQLFRDNQESEGFHVSGCTRKRTYVRFPFAYPTLEELISSRAVIDYETFESELSIENVPAESGLNELVKLNPILYFLKCRE